MRKEKRQLLALGLALLVTLPKVTAEPVMQSMKELRDSKEELTKEQIVEIAIEEIERTSQEAVKEAMKEAGGELSYWKERADLYEVQNEQLKYEFEQYKKEKRFETMKGALWGSGITAVVLGVVSMFCMCGR